MIQLLSPSGQRGFLAEQSPFPFQSFRAATRRSTSSREDCSIQLAYHHPQETSVSEATKPTATTPTQQPKCTVRASAMLNIPSRKTPKRANQEIPQTANLNNAFVTDDDQRSHRSTTAQTTVIHRAQGLAAFCLSGRAAGTSTSQ
jgi:hypothetical protein